MTELMAPNGPAARVARAPLWAHATVLLVVLVVVLPLAGTGVSYSADEGAAIIEARSLADGDGWIIPHPFPEVDPDGELYPLELSTQGPEGSASYAKHPAYPWLLSLADRVGGQPAMVVLSLLGTWMAAAVAAVLARLLTGGLSRTALWVAGVGSPLLFNGYWVIAHSLGAAAVAGAVIAVVVAVRDNAASSTGPETRWSLLVVAPVLVLGASMLRTEALFYGTALGLVTLVVGARLRRFDLVACGVAVGVSAALARVVDAELAKRIVGEPLVATPPFITQEHAGLVSGRIEGLVNTWLRPGPAGLDASSVVFVLIAGVLTLGAAIALRRSLDGPAVALTGSAAVLLVVTAVGLPAIPVPGLLLAFPVLVLGAAGAGSLPPGADRRAVWLVLAVLGLGWAGVLATQYPAGGTAEWGGRYFAIGLPLAIPLVLLATRPLVARVPEAAARAVIIALAVSMVALSTMSLRELRAGHRASERVFADVDALAAKAGPRAVVVTDRPALPRLDWAKFDERRWLLVDPDEVPDLPERLAALGVEQWVLVVADPDAALEAFPTLRVVERASPSILLVEETP